MENLLNGKDGLPVFTEAQEDRIKQIVAELVLPSEFEVRLESVLRSIVNSSKSDLRREGVTEF